MDKNYTKLHLHTDYSNGTTNVDSVTKYWEYIDRAKELGMKALAFTEHGNAFGWLSKKRACEKAGIKYIHGVEIYITEDLNDKKRDNYHTVLLAKNYEGFKEINSLISISNNREDGHFYYTPRISMDDFVSISNNVIVLSACLGSVLAKGTITARKRYLDYFIKNKDRCFLELQHHNVKDQINYNRQLSIISEKTGLKLVVATDTHSLNADKARGRDILQKAKNIHFDGEDSWDLTFKSYNELIDAYKVQDSLPMDAIVEAIEMTNTIADMIEDFEVDLSHKYPKMSDNPRQDVMNGVMQGLKTRGIDKLPNAKEYVDRIMEEMEVYDTNGAFDFLLLMQDVVDFCKANDIKLGYGRGSVTGSLIAYLLNITEMDSIKHNLIFSRFMHNERISLGDIDTDVEPSRRQEVRDYLFSKHDVFCADIVTFGTLGVKRSIENVGRAMGLSTTEVKTIKSLEEKDPDKARAEYPTIFEYVDIIVGTIESVGIHPAGVIVSPISLYDNLGLYTSKDTPYPIAQLEMTEVDSLNFVKLDLLGLDAVEVINNACELIGIDYITPDSLNAEDDAVWESLAEDTSFIFQLESDSARAYHKKLLSKETISNFRIHNPNFKRMQLLSIGNGAIRPAGASYRDDLSIGLFHDNGHEALNNLLSDTNGRVIFQENLILFLHELCGFSMGKADVVRKAFSKRGNTDQYIPEIESGFIKHMKDNYDMQEGEAKELIVDFLQVVADASDYLFNLNHAMAYSYMGYAEGWLRHYYPLEFVTAFMQVKQSKQDDIIAITKYAKDIGISVELPKYGKARNGFTMDKDTNTIYKGVISVKSVNKDIGDKLFDFYNANKELTNFKDILVGILDNKLSGMGNLITLAKIGFFRDYGKNAKIVQFIEDIYGKGGKGLKYDPKYTDKTKEKRLIALDKRWEELEDIEFTVLEQVKNEMEFLGYGETAYPDMPKDLYVVKKSEDKSWCVTMSCYNISSGENSMMYLALKNRVGIKKLKEFGILRVENIKLDRSDRSWIDSFTLLQ